jgi:hypothetical protein
LIINLLLPGAHLFSGTGRSVIYFPGRKDRQSLAAAHKTSMFCTPREINEALRLVCTHYAFRGEPNEAVKWLDLAYAQKDSGMLPLIKGDSSFNKIQADPRYKAFLSKMNLPE